MSRHRTPEPRTRLRVRTITALIAVLFLFGPIAAGAVGVRPSKFENHALARFPGLDAGWSWFTKLTPWATDNLPLRDKAVRANTNIDRRVFRDLQLGTSTLAGGWPQVFEGKSGNLFYGGDIRNKCVPAMSPQLNFANIKRLDSMVRASGRRFVLVTAPDKSDIEAAKLPADFRGKDCAAQRSAQMWPLLDSLPSFLDLRQPLLEAGAHSPYPLYIPRDSHWDGPGGAAFVKALAGRIQPDVVASFAERSLPPVAVPADLDVVAGEKATSYRHPVILEAPAVRHEFTTITEPNYVPLTFRSVGPPGTLVTAPTLIVGDSFVSASQPAISGVFANLTQLHQASASLARDVLIKQILAAKVVVVSVVERDLFTGNAHIIQTPFLDALQAALAAAPAR